MEIKCLFYPLNCPKQRTSALLASSFRLGQMVFIAFIILSVLHAASALAQPVLGGPLTLPPASPTQPVYLGRYPDNRTPNWGDNNTATQGVANDGKNWFFSATGTNTMVYGENPDWIIWRIPADEMIDQDFSKSTNPNVRHVRRTDVDILHKMGVTHPGDIDCHNGFLMVPMRGPNGAIIVVFKADDLSYQCYAELPGQKDIGWCAVSPEGNLVSSEDDASTLFLYSVKWDILANQQKLIVQRDGEPIQLKDAKNKPLFLKNIQGGEFYADGPLLYMSCGVSYKVINTDGIHVINTDSWKEVAHSINPERKEFGSFNFSFNNGAVAPDEPQGLTLWNLDNRMAPFITGQLHALVYSWGAGSSNKVTLMHYSFVPSDGAKHGVMLYQHPNYGGDSRYFNTDVGDLDLGSINFDDVTSSIQLIGISSVQLYDRRYFTGPSIKISNNVPDLNSLGWNDLVGSVRLGPNTIGTTPPHPGIRLFEHPNYKGDSRLFEVDVPDLDLGTINFADVASSIQIVGSAKVRVYDGHNYTGGWMEVSQNIPDLRTKKWNDKIGSIKFVR